MEEIRNLLIQESAEDVAPAASQEPEARPQEGPPMERHDEQASNREEEVIDALMTLAEKQDGKRPSEESEQVAKSDRPGPSTADQDDGSMSSTGPDDPVASEFSDETPTSANNTGTKLLCYYFELLLGY